MSAILGHQDLRKNLADLASKHSLAHSNLFVGPRGVGKRLVAKKIAQTLLCPMASAGVACQDCDSCRLLASGNHPDFYLIECESSDFKAEQARELLYSINLAPYRGHGRVILFNDADSLSTVVANLLLKSLEEPRKDTYFFLIAANASRLPIPVVSRCQIWRFASLSENDIRTYIRAQDTKESEEDLLELAQGSLENINDLAAFIPRWQGLKEQLENIVLGDSNAAMSLATKLSKDKDEISSNFSLIRLFLRASLRRESETNRKLVIADGLENIIEAERLICERNLGPLAVLNLCLLGLSGKLPAPGRLISEIVVSW